MYHPLLRIPTFLHLLKSHPVCPVRIQRVLFSPQGWIILLQAALQDFHHKHPLPADLHWQDLQEVLKYWRSCGYQALYGSIPHISLLYDNSVQTESRYQCSAAALHSSGVKSWYWHQGFPAHPLHLIYCWLHGFRALQPEHLRKR